MTRVGSISGGALSLFLLVALAEPVRAEPSAAIDREIEEIGALVEGAHFRTALSLVASTRELLEAEPTGRDRALRRAELELLAATAEVALGRRADARASLTRALRADPDLALDPDGSSPRIRELLAEVRR